MIIFWFVLPSGMLFFLSLERTLRMNPSWQFNDFRALTLPRVTSAGVQSANVIDSAVSVHAPARMSTWRPCEPPQTEHHHREGQHLLNSRSPTFRLNWGHVDGVPLPL